MEKRLKKKLPSPKFHFIQQAKRQKLNRRGRKTIFYEMVPIGREERLELKKDGHMAESPYATHWFAEIKDLVITIYDKEKRTTESLSTAVVYLCNEKEKTRQKSTLLTIFYRQKAAEHGKQTISEIAEYMKKDSFWESDNGIHQEGSKERYLTILRK